MLHRRRLLASGAVLGILPFGALRALESGAFVDPPFDVVVVGAGPAGLAAALSAREAGAGRVAILEKYRLAGGHALFAYAVNAMDPERQRRVGRTDSIAQFIEDTLAEGGGRADRALVAEMVRGSVDLVSWFESLGVRWDAQLASFSAAYKPRGLRTSSLGSTGMRLCTALSRALQAEGVSIRFALQGIALRLDEAGRMSGVLVRPLPGGEGFVMPARSVVLATGGFGASSEMLAAYAPRISNRLATSMSAASGGLDGATGDGIRMGMAAGGALAGMSDVVLAPDYSGRLMLLRGYELYLNEEGERFVDETISWTSLNEAMMRQPHASLIALTDSKSPKSGMSLSTRLQSGRLHAADSLEELALGLNVPFHRLQKTLVEYNQAARGEKPDPFGRRLFYQTIDSPPYFWSRESLTIDATLGGLAITPRAQVKASGSEGVVAGLFAAGEVTGGVHGRMALGGNTLTDALVFGRIAGREAALSAARG